MARNQQQPTTPPEPEPNKGRIVTCPGDDCDAEVNLDENEGECPKCGLDVEWVMEKARRDRAVKRVEERRAAEQPATQKKRKFFEF